MLHSIIFAAKLNITYLNANARSPQTPALQRRIEGAITDIISARDHADAPSARATRARGAAHATEYVGLSPAEAERTGELDLATPNAGQTKYIYRTYNSSIHL